ncbi:hypothetical protein [Burkholderia puraquae]|nr:hypothetical protein [Burkholderia puraquae]
MINLTAEELFFWIMVDETMNQLGEKSFSKGSIPVWFEIANNGGRSRTKFENQVGSKHRYLCRKNDPRAGLGNSCKRYLYYFRQGGGSLQ